MFDTLVAIAVLASVVVAPLVAGSLGVPLRAVFETPSSVRWRVAGAVAFAAMLVLANLQLASIRRLWGAAPMAWATVVMLIWIWLACSTRLGDTSERAPLPRLPRRVKQLRHSRMGFTVKS
ncbi:MAG: hypothetical protein AB7U20_05955 [Planctomycetaceae bacterium]